jgi:hypothetical protein
VLRARKIRDVRTNVPSGMPRIAGVSKPSRARTIMIRSPASRAGRTRGRVILRMTPARLAPLIIADSSSDGSSDRNAAAIRRKTMGDMCSPSTRIMPPIEKTSKRRNPRPIASSASLITPIRPLSRYTHATVKRIPGMISGTSETAKSTGFMGAFVRTVRYARAVPGIIATIADPAAKTTELTSISCAPSAAAALAIASSVRPPGPTNVL